MKPKMSTRKHRVSARIMSWLLVLTMLVGMVPINIRKSPSTKPSFSEGVPTGVSLLFPNGLQAHFGSGSEDVLMDLLFKSLPSHVLP